MTALRNCLEVHLWPEADQAAWNSVLAPPDFFEGASSRAADWRGPTAKKVRMGYGRWLSFLIGTERLDQDLEPAERITLENVKPYVLMLEEQVASWTVWTYVTSLHQVAMAFAPEQDWGWLYRITAKLKVRMRNSRPKLSRMQDADKVLALGLEIMDAAQESPDRRPTAAVRYRDGLLIAFLICCPVRLRNIGMIALDQHLRKIDGEYRVDYAPEEVKNNRYLTMVMPKALSPYVDAWLTEWRPILLRDPECQSFWIGIQGRPFGPRGIHKAIKVATEAAFSAPINPHLFRDIAATSTAIADPEHIGITSSILGHEHPKTTEDHYIQANQISATRRLRESITTARREARAATRRKKGTRS